MNPYNNLICINLILKLNENKLFFKILKLNENKLFFKILKWFCNFLPNEVLSLYLWNNQCVLLRNINDTHLFFQILKRIRTKKACFFFKLYNSILID